MRSVILTASLLLCFLGLKIRSVEAQSGEDVKLLCSNFSSIPVQITWFRVTNTSHLYHIASMFESQEDIKNGEGFPKEKFVMSSNMSVVFLTIKTVNVSDSGLYFCGYYISRSPVIIEATHLEVHGENPCQLDVFVAETLPDSQNSTYMLLGGLIVFLIVVIVALVFKIRSLLTEHSNNLIYTGSDGLNCAAVSFQHRTKCGPRQTAETEREPHVVYAATR
uniref:Ig-like domain-containing protein n=1 Tax=Salarias fasciatus TaxID=181472 RepID=A0A672IFJ2_SALFA